MTLEERAEKAREMLFSRYDALMLYGCRLKSS
jgi:hypothetical protein